MWVTCDLSFLQNEISLWVSIDVHSCEGMHMIRGEGTRLCSSLCNIFSFQHEAASEMNFRISLFHLFFFLERKQVRAFDIILRILQLPLQLTSEGRELWPKAVALSFTLMETLTLAVASQSVGKEPLKFPSKCWWYNFKDL